MNSPMLHEIIALITSILALCVSFAMCIMTLKRDSKSSNDEDISKEVRIAESFKELNVKLDFQSAQLDKLTKNSEESTKQFVEVNSKVTKIMEQIDTLFNYKDDHEKRIRNLEEHIK